MLLSWNKGRFLTGFVNVFKEQKGEIRPPADIDPTTGRKVRLHLGHIKDKNLGGKAELSNLRALCSTCNQGAKNITAEKPTTIWLLSQIRRAGQDEQRAVFDWLRKKFK